MNLKKYYLGLDIGTDSIGWAVTDEWYHLMKFNGKAMWGAHCFDAGKTAEERRGFRSARRRLARRAQRKKLLREFFANEIAKVDPDFYMRMDESFFVRDDKSVDQKNSLFNDKGYTDKDYFKEFKTIYHLRHALMTENKKFDIRLVYLAVEHILKHRGHFLYPGDMHIGNEFDRIYREWCEEVSTAFDADLTLTDTSELEKILKTPMGVTAKKKELNTLFGNLEKNVKAFVELLAGAKCGTDKIFETESEDAVKICFKDESIEVNRDKLLTSIGEDNVRLLDKTKALYDWGVLADLLHGKSYISEAKMFTYDKYGADLALLKETISEHISMEEYKAIFKPKSKTASNADTSAAEEEKQSSKKEKKQVSFGLCNDKDFIDYVKKLLQPFVGKDERADYIIAEIEKGTFMPKQVTKDNSVIPYQLHLAELKLILKNASKHYDFLNAADEYGTVADKIISLLTFRIPYYVGPLNPYHGKYAWIEKRVDTAIRPWNFYDVVDTEASAAKFIERMTNYCTYLHDQPVLAKNSLLYCRYMVYNELNNLKINGSKLTESQKADIYSSVYLTRTQPRKKDIIDALKMDAGETEISGIDEELKANMKPYLDFKRLIGDKVKDEDMVDDIIRLITIFGNEKTMLENQITKLYGDKLTEHEISSIAKLNYSGWGRLSRKLLKGLFADNTHENIITLMENTSENFMQIIYNEAYGFDRQLEEYNKAGSAKKGLGTYASLEDLYVSPANKKRIWRVMVLVKEIVKVMGCPPEKIFIEMARGEEEKVKTVSRKKQLENLYRSLKDEKELLAALGSETDSSLRRKKLYLYYRQMGRCLYSGKKIELSDLASYDIDHIIPRCVKSDDSLNNTALVLGTLNKIKGDSYPIPDNVVTQEARELWKLLLDKEFMSKEKYDRLIRKSQLTTDEKTEFIARQLVDTRQTTKIVADIFKEMYRDSEIVYVKAGNVSDFRHGGYLKKTEKEQYKDDYLVKVREINDFHHARDAYLNIVVGNIYNEYFNHDPRAFVKSGKHYHLARVCEYDVERAHWAAGHDGTITELKKILAKNNILYTVMPYEQRGGFFDQMLMKKGGGQYPIKTSDSRYANIDKYGGYNKIAGAYFALVRSMAKGKQILTFEPVPVYLDAKTKNDPVKLAKYFENQGIASPEVVLPKIKMKTLIKVDGSFVRITGRSNNSLLLCNSNQLCIDERSEKYIKKIMSFIGKEKKSESFDAGDIEGINPEENLRIYDLFTDKLDTTVYKRFLGVQYTTLKKGRDKFIGLSLNDQCHALYEILKFFKCDRTDSDISLIGGSKRAGVMTINKKIDSSSDIKIINQSITGLFESETDISKL